MGSCHRATPSAAKPPLLSREEMQQVLLRPLPPTLYKCPISEPTTTIVPYDWLPKQVQDKVNLDKARIFVSDSDDDIIVEIPVAWMEPAAATTKGATTSSLVTGSLAGQRRQGNLRDKLTEYTRGSRLQQPFRPGGLGPADSNHHEDDEDATTSALAIERNAKVLEMSQQELWQQGLLLTAPPGVSFRVGLSLDDVNKVTTTSANEVATQEASLVAETDVAPLVEEDIHSDPTRPLRTVSAPLFSKGYFDDDSLFGSSSSDDDEEEDSGEEPDNGEEKEEQAESPLENPVGSLTYSKAAETSATGESGQDIDSLLAELTLDPMKAKSSKADLPANPLELAERQAKDQLNTTRKEWANTKYLPIKDFDALIPNPALVYPFTLDDFQQQAVARLERNEVSAGCILEYSVVSSYCFLTCVIAVGICSRTHVGRKDSCGRVRHCLGHASGYAVCLHISH